MIDNHELFESGLCIFIVILFDKNIINNDELDKLYNYIVSHRPKEGEKHYNLSQVHSNYYWKYNEWLPRQAWLEDQVKKSIFIWLKDQIKKHTK